MLILVMVLKINRCPFALLVVDLGHAGVVHQVTAQYTQVMQTIIGLGIIKINT